MMEQPTDAMAEESAQSTEDHPSRENPHVEETGSVKPEDETKAAENDEPEQSPEERIKALEEELEQEKERSEGNRNDYLRAMADMDNLRKRTEREKENARKFALEGFSRDLLTLADNVDRALTAIRSNMEGEEELAPLIKSLAEGAEMIEGELQRTFAKHGIEKIEAAGKPFDANLHQAMTQVETEEAESGSVVQELQTGYLLNGRLLRPSLVNVAQ
ncbi:MAG: nucleotide exchange factor GrpE [Magnetococcales bacterium]|nr:nucleotide exchange factor GrpE [Magnetococcales bacterium]